MKDTEDQFNETTKPPSTSCELPTREFWATPRASKRMQWGREEAGVGEVRTPSTCKKDNVNV